MTNRRFLAAHLPIFASYCLLLGCADHSGRPATASVRGKVTYLGSPVAGASVTFLAPGAPRFAVGTTDDEGNYLLTTFEPDDGAIPGTHVVTVRKDGDQPPATISLNAQPADPTNTAKSIEQAMQDTAQQMKVAEKERSLLPLKYADGKTSDLRKHVQDGENVIDIDLKD
jgi:hypothetical protein